MNSNYNHVDIPAGQGPLYRVDNLVRHESGHSFGLGNGTFSAPPSVMAQNSFDATNTLQSLRVISMDTGEFTVLLHLLQRPLRKLKAVNTKL
jgi:hypothetical protein